MKNEVREKIKKYKELKADIVDIDLRLQELEEDMLGISALPQGEKTSRTYKISFSVEEQAERHLDKKQELLLLKAKKQRSVLRIDNALSILDDEQKEIIESILINNRRYCYLEEKLCLSYPRIKQLEAKAIGRMKKYVI